MRFQPFCFVVLMGLTLFAFSACGNDDSDSAVVAPLTLVFDGNIMGERLALESKTYQAPGVAEGIRVSRLSFFLTDIKLISSSLRDGTPITTLDLSPVEYVELGPNGSASLQFEDLPLGFYDKVQFRVGLRAEQDASKPTDFPASSPLSNASEYWVDWGSYIFMKIEGKADLDADGQARFDKGFVYHIGKSAQHARQIELTAGISLGGDGTTRRIAVDLGELLGFSSSEPIPLDGAPDHRNERAGRIMDNATNAFAFER